MIGSAATKEFLKKQRRQRAAMESVGGALRERDCGRALYLLNRHHDVISSRVGARLKAAAEKCYVRARGGTV
jgi:hypothetical protein